MADELKVELGKELPDSIPEPHVPDVIDPAWVEGVVRHIREVSDDAARAHSLEDWLHQVVLHRMASGDCRGHSACAMEAIQTLHLKFPRWVE